MPSECDPLFTSGINNDLVGYEIFRNVVDRVKHYQQLHWVYAKQRYKICAIIVTRTVRLLDLA